MQPLKIIRAIYCECCKFQTETKEESNFREGIAAHFIIHVRLMIMTFYIQDFLIFYNAGQHSFLNSNPEQQQ